MYYPATPGPSPVASGHIAAYHAGAPGLHPASPYQPGYHPYSYGLPSPSHLPQVSGQLNAGGHLPLCNPHQGSIPSPPYGFDTTGQIPPHGVRPKITATFWEDENCMCFQVEARGVCVARREDNNMINGTKLLNVAGMTRGRRDGILKSEKVRQVVKIGPMHLKGVWIPFDRALDFANKEKITESLYPLFVTNLNSMLYPSHTVNPPRHNEAVPAVVDRKKCQVDVRNGNHPSLPSAHPAMSALPHPTLPSQQSAAIRSSGERAALATPPSTNSSGMGSIDGSDGYTYPPLPSNASSNNVSVDQGFSSTRSLPTTPASTPPGSSIQHMTPSYAQQTPVSQTSYDSSRQLYSSASSQQSPYQPLPSTSYHQSSSVTYAHTSPVSYPAGPPSTYGQAPAASYSQPPVASYSPAPVASYSQAPAATYTQAPPVSYAPSPVASHVQTPAATHAHTPKVNHASAPSARHTPAPAVTYPQASPIAYAQAPPLAYSQQPPVNYIKSDMAPPSPRAVLASDKPPLSTKSNNKRGRDDDDDGGKDTKRHKTTNIMNKIATPYPAMATTAPSSGGSRRL